MAGESDRLLALQARAQGVLLSWDRAAARALSQESDGSPAWSDGAPEMQARVLRLLAMVDHRLGEHERAVRRLRRAIQIFEMAEDPGDSVAQTAIPLIAALDALDRTAEADAVLARAVRQVRSGAVARVYVRCFVLSTAGLRAHARGEYAEAAALMQAAVDASGVLDSTQEAPNLNWGARTLSALSVTHDVTGDWEAALQERELAAGLYMRDGQHRAALTDRLSLADLRYRTGDREGALRERAEVEQALSGPDAARSLSPADTVRVLRALAETRWHGDDPRRPETLLGQAVSLAEERDPDGLGAAEQRLPLARAQRRRGGLAEAQRTLDEAESLLRGRTDPGQAGEVRRLMRNTLMERAVLARLLGRPQLALSLLDEALTVVAADPTTLDPDNLTAIRELALASAAAGRPDDALQWLRQADAIEGALAGEVVNLVGEAGQLNYVRLLRATMAAALVIALDHPDVVAFAYRLVLQRKGLVGDVVARRRAALLDTGHPAAEQFLTWSSRRARLTQVMLAGAGDGETAQDLDARVRAARREVAQAEAALVQASPESAWLVDGDTGHREVAAALGADEVLVELVRFGRPAVTGSPASGAADGEYVAFVVLPDDPAGPRLLSLGPAEPIEAALAPYRSLAAGSGRDLPGGHGPERQDTGPDRLRRLVSRREEPYLAAGRTARQLLFDPLEPHLRGRRRLCIAADGEATQLSFAALPTDQAGYLLDRYTIWYATSGRDLLRSPSSAAVGPALVVADPDFDLGVDVDLGLDLGGTGVARDPGRSRGLDRRFRSLGTFTALHGAREEGRKVADILGVEPLVGAAATKGAVRRHPPPRILHLATHGFFLPHRSPDELEEQTSELADRSAQQDPLLRCGLALAGANTALAGAALPDDIGDGILNGHDMAALNLAGTSLVTMSACESGLGDVRVGEGVLGLARGALVAGARAVLITLWKVPDALTSRLMQSFYTRLQAGEDSSDALRGAQLEARSRGADPNAWGAFVLLGRAALPRQHTSARGAGRPAGDGARARTEPERRTER